MSDQRRVSVTPCASCGEEGYSLAYIDGPNLRRMLADGVCFSCAFWRIRCDKGPGTVINGVDYGPGSRTSGEMRGMAGRRFDIEYFSGQRITTFDLWSGGQVPERFRERLPDTARFLNGAHEAMAGGGLCWNPSERQAPVFPLPNGRQVPEAMAPGGYAS